MTECKGTLFASVKLFVEQNYGADAVDRVMKRLSADDQRLLSSTVAVGWYPAAPIFRFHCAVDEMFGKGDLALCYDIGKFGAQWQLNSIHKFILRWKSPAWIYERGFRMWDQYYNEGTWSETHEEPFEMIGTLRDFSLQGRAFCERMRGFFAGGIELTGGRNAVVKEASCRMRGSDQCVFVATWQKK